MLIWIQDNSDRIIIFLLIMAYFILNVWLFILLLGYIFGRLGIIIFKSFTKIFGG